MTKNFKLVLAIILAVMMIVGSISAVADDTFMPTASNDIVPSDGANEHVPLNSSSYDNTITVSGLDTGDSVTFYPIVKWVGSKAGNVQGWAAVDEFAGILTHDVLAAILGADGATATNFSAEIAAQLALVSPKPTGITKTESSGSVSLTKADDNIAPGVYMAIVDAADPDTMYNPVFVSSDFNTSNATSSWAIDSSTMAYSGNASVKKSISKLDKTARASDDTWDKPYSADAVAVGDTVHFTVTTKIPAFMAYEYPSFAVTDKLTDLKLKANTITVTPATYGSNTPTYSKTNGDDNYTITFAPEYLKTLGSPVEVTIEYDAVVLESAVVKNVNQQVNEVSTVFSSNPADSSDYKVKKDVTKHYTFTIDAETLYGYMTQSGQKGSEIVKVGLDAAGNPIESETVSTIVDDVVEHVAGPLQGAEFKLYTNEACTEEYKPWNADGTAKLAQETFTSGPDGRLTISGLDAGTYYLLETRAPDGYIKSNTPVKIEITATYKDDVEVTEYYNKASNTWNFTKIDASQDKEYTYKTKELESYTVLVNGHETTHVFEHTSDSVDMTWVTTSAKEIPTSIPNVKGVELPSTGGIGTTIFYVGGSLMVLAAAILLITKRRMGVED